ncbi:MAG: hypothetical protein OXQ28_13575 [Acidobacteriota bacterium]|nr:hypothetical protein [Acidobacteriota bacterium]
MKVKLAAVMALAAVILVIAAYLFGMSWGPAPQSNRAPGDQEQVRRLTEENTRLQLEIQRLESELRNLELQLERLQTERENQQQENQGLDDDLIRLREEAVQMDAEIERLRLENQRLRDRLLEDRASRTGPLWFLVAVLTVLAAAFAWAWHRERQRFISSSTVRVHRPLDPATHAVTPANPTDTGLQKQN